MDSVDFVGYIIMFLFGLGVLGIYQYNKSKTRLLPLSRQIYPDIILEVLIKKQHEKTRNLVVRVNPKKEVSIGRVYIELIGRQREIQKVGFAEKDITYQTDTKIYPDQPVEIVIPVPEFRNYLQSKGIRFTTFRFVVDALPNNRHKTHELAFNRSGNIYKPDSGRYN
jgi:hypothetical protein